MLLDFGNTPRLEPVDQEPIFHQAFVADFFPDQS
jgi:hypothetical protein